MNRYGVPIVALCLISGSLLSLYSLLSSQENSPHKWITISGKWTVRKDGDRTFAMETMGKTKEYGYSELINRNTLMTMNPLPRYSAVRCAVEVANPSKSPVEVLLVFAARSDKEFFAFGLSGDDKGINCLSLLVSRVKDTTRPRDEKWNFEVREVCSKECGLEYGREYPVLVKIREDHAALLVDGKKLLECEAEGLSGGGYVGFSNRNAVLKVAAVEALDGRIPSSATTSPPTQSRGSR